jgi:hypothetical protein
VTALCHPGKSGASQVFPRTGVLTSF